MRLLLPPVAATLLALALPAFAAPAAPAAAGSRVEVKVTSGGWVPDRIPARAGQPLTLVVTRTTDRTCATEIVVKDYGINARLPLNQPVTVTFTPRKAGEVRFACGMDMITGVVVVQ
jgi:plastocyanin domain-containing protein